MLPPLCTPLLAGACDCGVPRPQRNIWRVCRLDGHECQRPPGQHYRHYALASLHTSVTLHKHHSTQVLPLCTSITAHKCHIVHKHLSRSALSSSCTSITAHKYHCAHKHHVQVGIAMHTSITSICVCKLCIFCAMSATNVHQVGVGTAVRPSISSFCVCKLAFFAQ